MIKLNNKNITYVALADSNNSVKGVKEIWYADSSNSVKLVYRRKDALIEGEDYENYHWLQGRNGAYIDTNYYPIVGTDIFSVHFHYDGTSRNPDGFEQVIFGVIFDNNKAVRAYINGNNHLACNYCITNTFPSTNIHNTEWVVDNLMINGEYYQFIANDVNYSFSNNNIPYTVSSHPLYVFKGSNQVYNANCYLHGDISSFKITDTSSNTKINLIPCKLLKPVPKWLDANGIRRQIGECGMIDLVSGKFYGNVNSVGTFTVENYYERKEWLQGDGSAYIDTNVIVNSSTLKLELQYRLGNESYQPIFGSRDNVQYESQNTVLWVTDYTKFRLDLLSEGSSVQHCNALDINSIEFDATVPKVTINGNEFTSNKSFTNSVRTFRIFDLYLRDATNKRSDGSMSYFKLNDGTNKLDLIPCTLTMDLPASMDANNIARTKGTSGMWDLVSDRFYGNVANSGTFKAVNLAEGVDYEVHQWLVGDGSAYIEGINYNLWDNTISLQIGKTNVRGSRYFAANHLSITEDMSSSPSYLMVIFRQNSDSIPHIADIDPYSSMPDVVTMDFYIENSLFYCNQNGVVKTNNPAQTAIESTWKSVASRIYSAKMSYIREVLPNGSYNSNLIPVKLLKSIPSKYDANGIARQAGECGMYDTVNDVFYGNVASSGTFSVSDDS